MLDNEVFAWIKEPSITAIWMVFALIFGTLSAGAFYTIYGWVVDILGAINASTLGL